MDTAFGIWLVSSIELPSTRSIGRRIERLKELKYRTV